MQGTMVGPVASKHEFTQFIDCQYDRNRRDEHFITPLRLGEIEKPL